MSKALTKVEDEFTKIGPPGDKLELFGRVSKNAQARKRRLQKMEVKSGFRRKFEEGT